MTATQLTRIQLAAIARQFPQLTFAIADTTDNRQLFADFGFDEHRAKYSIGIIGTDSRLYPLDPPLGDHFYQGTVHTFLNRFKRGILKLHCQSVSTDVVLG